jgi:hypothetical protein
MKKLFLVCPAARLSAREAMAEPFFDELRAAYANANDGRSLPIGGAAFDASVQWRFGLAQQDFYRNNLLDAEKQNADAIADAQQQQRQQQQQLTGSASRARLHASIKIFSPRSSSLHSSSSDSTGGPDSSMADGSGGDDGSDRDDMGTCHSRQSKHRQFSLLFALHSHKDLPGSISCDVYTWRQGISM